MPAAIKIKMRVVGKLITTAALATSASAFVAVPTRLAPLNRRAAAPLQAAHDDADVERTTSKLEQQQQQRQHLAGMASAAASLVLGASVAHADAGDGLHNAVYDSAQYDSAPMLMADIDLKAELSGLGGIDINDPSSFEQAPDAVSTLDICIMHQPRLPDADADTANAKVVANANANADANAVAKAIAAGAMAGRCQRHHRSLASGDGARGHVVTPLSSTLLTSYTPSPYPVPRPPSPVSIHMRRV